MLQIQPLEMVEERFRAVAGLAVDPNTPQDAYTIDVEFLGGLTNTQKELFKSAARRWSRVIVGDLPSATVNGRDIDDLLIQASGQDIDGVGQVLGRAGPTAVRDGTSLPATAIMEFDTADLNAMEQDGRLEDVIVHEMGHCIGIGTIWERKQLLTGKGTANPLFVGVGAEREYGTLVNSAATPVPVENTGGAGTRDGHWRDETFGNEMMTGFISKKGNPISRMTVAALEDMGYVVDLANAESYHMPGPSIMMEWSFSLEAMQVERPEFEVIPD